MSCGCGDDSVESARAFFLGRPRLRMGGAFTFWMMACSAATWRCSSCIEGKVLEHTCHRRVNTMQAYTIIRESIDTGKKSTYPAHGVPVARFE